MFRYNPEVAFICVAVGLILVARGWYALRKRTIMVKKPIGLPWHYNEVSEEKNPRTFRLTAWGIIVLGICFILFPFLITDLV